MKELISAFSWHRQALDKTVIRTVSLPEDWEEEATAVKQWLTGHHLQNSITSQCLLLEDEPQKPEAVYTVEAYVTWEVTNKLKLPVVQQLKKRANWHKYSKCCRRRKNLAHLTDVCIHCSLLTAFTKLKAPYKSKYSIEFTFKKEKPCRNSERWKSSSKFSTVV